MPIDQGAHFVATADGVIAAIGFGFVCGAICGYGTAMGQLAARHWRKRAAFDPTTLFEQEIVFSDADVDRTLARLRSGMSKGQRP